ncbi:MAG TPA: hypothetical protein ENK05_07520 [Gammaproteobacteria bacterium]|nr:hypothetical protein [Gammaproteobacteria bacterium]
MSALEPEVEQAVDRICALGCSVVNTYIQALERGETRPEYRELTDERRASLLRELQSIMAVYRLR